MKKLSTVLAVLLLAALVVFPAQSVAAATANEFNTAYQTHNAYYEEVYVPVYHNYKAALQALRDKVTNEGFATVAEAERAMSELTALKAEHTAFFGNRETEGKSRFVVPAHRTAMQEAARAGDYTTAAAKLADLDAAVKERVGVLNNFMTRINNITTPVFGHVLLKQTVDGGVHDYYYYSLTITNASEAELRDWNFTITLEFTKPAGATSSASFQIDKLNPDKPIYYYVDWDKSVATKTSAEVKRDGAGYTKTSALPTYTLKPSGQYQAGYVFPVGDYLTFECGGRYVSNVVSATLNGKPLSVSFEK